MNGRLTMFICDHFAHGSACMHACNCYRPQRSCSKVMFLHLSAILSTGGYLPQYMLRYTPPGQTPPEQTPPGQTPPPPAVTAADGTHPTGMHSCFHLCSTVQLPYTNVTLQFFILAFAQFSGINISCNSFRIIQTCNLLY